MFSFLWITVELLLWRTMSPVWKIYQRTVTRKSWPPRAILKGPSRLSRATPASVCVKFFTFIYSFFTRFLFNSRQRCQLQGVFGLCGCVMFCEGQTGRKNDRICWAVFSSERVTSLLFTLFEFQNPLMELRECQVLPFNKSAGLRSSVPQYLIFVVSSLWRSLFVGWFKNPA